MLTGIFFSELPRPRQWSNCKIEGSGTLWRARERLPIMGVEPSAGSRGKALGQGSGGEATLKLKIICFWTLGRSVELVGFSVFHSVQCGSVSESREICHLS